MEMLVRVDVVERQPGSVEGLELGRDFAAQLPPHARAQCNVEGEPHHISA